GAGRGAQALEGPEEGLDAEVRQGAAEEDGGQLAGEEALLVPDLPGAVEQLDLGAKVGRGLLSEQALEAGVVDARDVADGLLGVARRALLEAEDRPREAVIDALEEVAAADGP